MKQDFNGGTHNHYYALTQQELALETKEPITFRTSPKNIAFLNERAEREGISRSVLIEKLLIRALKSERAVKKAHRELEEIVTEFF